MKRVFVTSSVLTLCAASTALSQDVPVNPLREAYFGNLHVHTAWSFDANINGAISGPDEAYRWARGEAIPGGGGGPDLKILRPLDWYSVGDHAEYLGALPLMADPESPVSKHPLAAAISGDDATASFAAYTEILDGISNRRNDPILGDPVLLASVWEKIIDIADQHYKPGEFTTFAGFEWTSNPGWRNLHRVVIFRDTENVSDHAFSAIESDREEDLWAWMDLQRVQGAELLAVPHNGNASDGLMFPIGTSYGGSDIDSAYAETRMRNEPLYELTQIKGTSEVHPSISPNDEFANFELWDYTLESTASPPEHKVGGYMREALIRGMALEAEGKGNPFKYGFIGDSDTHNAASTIEENNYTGKFGFENNPEHRLEGPPGVSEAAAQQVREFSSGGLAGVWAESNTREAIFDAMVRKETFATSGVRMRVRMFGGYDYAEDMMESADWLQAAYDGGVPMGGDLAAAPEGTAPTFLIAAMKEADGANLDRIQVIKGWVENGEQKEQIYDVALSGGRTDGSEPVGNTVDVADASYTNDIGAADLTAAWTDPDFDPAVPAVYYARVLQIPTPRWSTYDAKALGVDVPDGLPTSIQERAWTSPIWYAPE
ncbi:hypothetical protein CEW88_18875 [Alloyangia pacifica]|uniref:DUF3604 domain-containing protein n=1 Tax=Alloyangia pacifica TaxID=311180 RepID=A0A2U8HKZ3_9RHOB|nr:DUF3604 domain-containing protein [Alloyangia pacifica]AWI85746.1 hypothetical protein CEW88_18875 [Alloyangia pacifica]